MTHACPPATDDSPMRRAVLGFYTYLEFFAIAVLLLPAFAIVALIHRSTDPTMRARGRMMRFFGRFTSSVTPMWRFSVDGDAPADIATRGYVVISNHESTADPFLLTHLPFDMRFIAKEELFRLPLIGWLMRLSGDIPLRRGDGASVRAMLEACRTTLRHGLSVFIFPEGTRSPDGSLLPFKDGAFSLAIETGAPLLPLALAGTRSCRPKGSLWFGQARARVRVLQPIPTEGLTLADLPALKERARRMMEAALTDVRVRAAQPSGVIAPIAAAAPPPSLVTHADDSAEPRSARHAR